jgi:hypothetical protein
MASLSKLLASIGVVGCAFALSACSGKSVAPGVDGALPAEDALPAQGVRAPQAIVRAGGAVDMAYVATVDTFQHYSILGFPASTSGSATPSIVLDGPLTGFNNSISNLASDAAGDLYVQTQAANLEGAAIEEFPPGANGNVAPSRVLNIETVSASLGPGQPQQALNIAPGSIAADSKGYLYVAASLEPPPPFTSYAMAVLVYAPGAQGNDAPAKILDQQSVSTPLSGNAITVAVNASDDVYVAQKTGTTNAFVSEYSSFGAGNHLLATSPSSWGPAYSPAVLAVGPRSGTVFAGVAVHRGAYFFVSGNPQLTKILGYVRPSAPEVSEIAIDSSDELFTFSEDFSVGYVNTIEVYRASADGTAPPIRKISETGLTSLITIVPASHP